MTKGVRGRRSGLIMWVAILAMIGLLSVVIAGCGSDSASGEDSITTVPASGSEQGQSGDEGEGVALAKKVLATFDEMVAEMADAAKDTPEPAVLESALQDIDDQYVGKMLELNEEFEALREEGGSEFGAFNNYINENRGKHVTEKDNTLTEAVKYYNLELGDQDMVSRLVDRPVELLNLALGQL